MQRSCAAGRAGRRGVAVRQSVSAARRQADAEARSRASAGARARAAAWLHSRAGGWLGGAVAVGLGLAAYELLLRRGAAGLGAGAPRRPMSVSLGARLHTYLLHTYLGSKTCALIAHDTSPWLEAAVLVGVAGYLR